MPGGELPQADFKAFLDGVQRRWPFLPDRLARRLAHAYGTRISDIVAAARNMEDLGTHFGAGLTRAEVDYLRSHEWAQTADDILWRRTKIGLHITPEHALRSSTTWQQSVLTRAIDRRNFPATREYNSASPADGRIPACFVPEGDRT